MQVRPRLTALHLVTVWSCKGPAKSNLWPVSHLQPLQHPQGSMIQMWTLGNWLVVMTVATSRGHVIPFCGLQTSKVNEGSQTVWQTWQLQCSFLTTMMRKGRKMGQNQQECRPRLRSLIVCLHMIRCLARSSTITLRIFGAGISWTILQHRSVPARVDTAISPKKGFISVWENPRSSPLVPWP